MLHSITLGVSTSEGETQKDTLADSDTERKEQRHQLPKTDTDHCSHGSDMPTSRFTHTLLIQTHHSGSARHSQIYKHIQNTDIHKSRTHMPQNPKDKELRIYILLIYRDKYNFRYILSDSHTGTYAMQTHATSRSTDTHGQTPIPQDRQTHSTHRFKDIICPES